jgi:putative transposase
VLPKSTVDDDVARWRADGTGVTLLDALRAQTRRQAGRASTPRVACIASHAVKTTEMGGRERGYDGGKKGKGRKRHLWVDTLGLLLVVLITRAGRADGVAAPKRLQLIEPKDVPRLETRCADHKDHHHALHTWRAEPRPHGRREVKTRPAGVTGCTPLENRWVVERTNAWNGRDRRHRKDYERQPESSAAMIYISTMHVMLRRLTSHCRPEFHSRSVTADSLKLAS